MTRVEFLKGLTKALGNYSIAEAAVILTRCDRLFQRGLAAGRREEEICAALGEPGVLARRLRPGRRHIPGLERPRILIEGVRLGFSLSGSAGGCRRDD